MLISAFFIVPGPDAAHPLSETQRRTSACLTLSLSSRIMRAMRHARLQQLTWTRVAASASLILCDG
jgi:hypothetical protein